MTRSLASISLDLDNKWSYLRVHGDSSWEEYATYLPQFTARFLKFCDARQLKTTVFVVGKDATVDANREHIANLAGEHHEIGNHSFRHEPWLHRYSDDELHHELSQAENAIEAVTGVKPKVFRGPGYSISPKLIEELCDRDYLLDASTFPTFIGPLARMYYFFHSSMTNAERKTRERLFGTFRDGMRPLKPYTWTDGSRRLLEIPVTTIPFIRTPFHFSYLIYLARFSLPVATAYLRSALIACARTGTAPSMLLHPLDFLGASDVDGLDFFPGMDVNWSTKRDWVTRFLDILQNRFDVLPMSEYASRLDLDALPSRSLDVGATSPPLGRES